MLQMASIRQENPVGSDRVRDFHGQTQETQNVGRWNRIRSAFSRIWSMNGSNGEALAGDKKDEIDSLPAEALDLRWTGVVAQEVEAILGPARIFNEHLT